MNRDHNSSIICDLKAKVQMLAAEVLRLQQQQQPQHVASFSAEGKSSEDGKDATVVGCLLPIETLQELANSTPSKSVLPRLSKRFPDCTPSMEESELTSMSARALEAESEVMRLVEELKLARAEASKLSDTVASLRAERDVMTMGVDAWQGLAAEGSLSTIGDEEDTSAHTHSSAKKKGRRSKLFRFFPLKNDNNNGRNLASTDELHGNTNYPNAGAGSQRGSEVDATDAKKAAVSVLKEFHERMESMKNRLDESERQRKALEHQLVSSSVLLGCENKNTSRIARVRSHDRCDISSQFTTTMTIFARAEEQLWKERRRYEHLSHKLSSRNIITTTKDGAQPPFETEATGTATTVGMKYNIKKEDEELENEENCDPHVVRVSDDNSTEDEEEESLDEEDRSIVSGTGAEEMELCAKHQEKKITMELGELEKGIAMKEELLVALRDNKVKFDAMEHHYKQKLGEMDVEVRRMEADHEKLLEEVKAVEMKNGHHNTAGTNHTEKFRDMLKKKTVELEAAKKRQQELTRLAAGREKEAARVKGLGEEIFKMKRARVVLQKNLENQRREHAALIQMKAREIANLKRGARKNAGEISKLVAAQHRAEATGRRHLEELSMLRRTLRQKQQRGKSSTTRLKKQELEMKRWVEERMTETAKKEEQAAQLTAEYEKKLILLQQKENLELARASITTRTHGPWSPPVSPSAAPIESKEDRVTAKIFVGSGNSTSNSSICSPSELPYLSVEEQETLQEVEERLESIITELAYKEEKIKSMERKKSNGCKGGDIPSGGGGAIVFQELVSHVNDVPSSHSIIRVLLEGLMDAKRAQMMADSEASNLQDRVRASEDVLEETREMAAAESRKFDTTLVQVSTDFEKKIAGLLAHATETAAAAASSSDISAGINGTGGGGGGSVMTQEEAKGGGSSFTLNLSSGSANDRALLGLSSERNNTLRGMVRTLEARISEAMQRCKDVEGGRKEERRRRLEKEQEADWLSFELKSLRKRHLELQGQWEELKLSHSDLLRLKNEGGVLVGVEGTDDNVHVNMEDGRLMTPSYVTEGQGIFDFESLDDDIAAIAQGKIPESMAMVLEMSQEAVGDSNEEQKGQRSVFERLATTTTTSRALKVQDKEHVHENYKRKVGPVKVKKECPYVEGQAAVLGVADQGGGTGEIGGGGGIDASTSRVQTILPVSSSQSDLTQQQHLSDNNAPIPSSSKELRDKEAADTTFLLFPPPPPPLSFTTPTTSSSMNIFDRLSNPTSFPVARIQKQRGNARTLPARTNICAASITGFGGDLPQRQQRLTPNNNLSRSLQSPLSHQSNELPPQQQDGQQPRKRSVFDRLRTNITKSEAQRQAEVAAKSSSCVIGIPNPASNGTTPSHHWEGPSSEAKAVI